MNIRSDSYRDPATLTQQEAGELFGSLAQRAATDQDLDLGTAWRQTRLQHPALHERAFNGDAGKIESRVHRLGTGAPSDSGPADIYRDNGGSLAPALRTAARPLMPAKPLRVAVPNAGNLEALGLDPANPDVDFDLFKAADFANGGASPRNAAAIHSALLKELVGRGMSEGAAADEIEELAPSVAAEVAGQPTTATREYQQALSAALPSERNDVVKAHARVVRENPDLAGRMKAPAPDDGGQAAASDASAEAEAASAAAMDKRGHEVAAAAQIRASVAQENVGNAKEAKRHRALASGHAERAR